MDTKLKNVKLLLGKKKLDALLISSVANITYLTNYDGFSYFEREAFLLITPKENFLITDGRYSEAVTKIPGFKLLEISNQNLLDDILKSLSKKIKKLGVEESNISLSEGKKLKKYFKLIPLKDLENLRIIKNENEILKIQKACQIGDETFNFILKKMRIGITEKEIAFEIEMFIKKSGADISFPPIVAFGKNSSIPHHKTGNSKLSKNQIVLLDFGVKLNNYCSDMTRTVFFGKADDKFKKIYNTVLKAQKSSIDILYHISIYDAESSKASDIDNAARTHIIKSGFDSIPHSLGHGIGIDVHEAPRLSPKSKEILKPGMVFSIEPGIYIPGYGGVRIEDIVVLKKSGPRLLTHSQKNLIEI